VHAHILVRTDELTFGQSQYAHTVAGKGAGSGAPGMPERCSTQTEAPLRLAHMDATGVDIQVISPQHHAAMHLWLECRAGVKIERIGNEAVADGSRGIPTARRAGLAARSRTWRVDRELGDACATSTCGAIVSSHVNGTELATSAWRRSGRRRNAGRRDLHRSAGNCDDRMRRNRSCDHVGQPMEEPMRSPR